MSEVKRYDWHWTTYNAGEMKECSDGEYVLAEHYETLLTENKMLRISKQSAMDDCKARWTERDTLAAENKRLQVQVNALRQHKTDYMEAAEGTRRALEAELAALKGDQVAVAWAICREPGKVDELSATYANKSAAAAHIDSYGNEPGLFMTDLYTHPCPQQPGPDVAGVVPDEVCRRLLFGFGLDCNTIGLLGAAENLRKGMKAAANDKQMEVK